MAALVEKQEIRTTRARSVLSVKDLLSARVVALNLAQISAPRQAWRDENSLQGELGAARVLPVPMKEEDMEAPLSCDAQISMEQRSSELYGMQRISSNTAVATRCRDVRSLSRSWRRDHSSDRALTECLEYIRHLHILGATWGPVGAFQCEYQDGQSRFAH